MNNTTQRRRRVRKNRSHKAQISRILLTVCMMALVAVVSIGGTIAWLTDNTETITNTFTESDIDIELVETKGDGDTNLLANSYKMVPGVDIEKDPKVKYLKGNEAGWLFVQVEKVGEVDDYLSYTIDTAWTAVDATNHPGVYYINQANTLGATQDTEYSVLAGDKVTVKSAVTKEMMDALKAENATLPQLKFTAYAIQQANLKDASNNELGAERIADIWEMVSGN